MPENEKLVVAPFNKKDIEQISVDATKKAISDGEIIIPSGGAALYKHTVVIQDGETDQFTFIVVSTSQEQITSETFYENAVSVSNANKKVSDSMSIYLLPAYAYGVEGSAQEGKAQFTYLIKNNSSLNISTGYAMSIVSDNVTEL